MSGVACRSGAVGALLLAAAASPGAGALNGFVAAQQSSSAHSAPLPRSGAVESSDAQSSTYRVYVANESSDIVSRVAFTPGQGAVVEKEITVGIMPGDNDGAHGVTVSPDGRFWYVTISHGTPYGYLWKFDAGPDTLVGRARLGLFPATIGATPGGEFLLVSNFNLHGDMTPSDVSVVYAPEMMEVTRVETCLMPHGSRVAADGAKHYSVCMHSDELVEIDVAEFRVSRRFGVVPGAGRGQGRRGGPEAEAGAAHADHEPGAAAAGAVCSPTWAEPGQGAGANRFVYVACNKSDEVLEVDVERWSVTRRFATGRAPYNLEVTADGMRLLATLKGEQGVAVYDLESGALLGRAGTSRPVTHGVTASPDGRWAFVSNESVGSVRGTLDVIDLETLEVVETVELEHQSGGIDFWQPPPEAEVGPARGGAAPGPSRMPGPPGPSGHDP